MALAMMGEASMPPMHRNMGRDIEPDTDGDKVRKEEKYRQVLKSKGVQEFNINGMKIMARSEKKAYEKFNKRKLG